jgi:hypothetical protein
MISGTGVLLAFVVFGLLVVAAAIVWWINRTPSAYRRASESELPLFSVSLTESRYSPVKPQAAIPSARSANGRSAKVESSRGAGERAGVAGEAVVSRGAGMAGVAAGAAGAGVAAADDQTPLSTTVVTPSAQSGGPGSVSSPPPSTRTPSGQRSSTGAAGASGAANTSPTPAGPLNVTARPIPEASQAMMADGVPGTQVEGHLLRFSVPQEGTLQFLPGRLEILNGLDAGREVRFVRAPGPDGLQVTFGRNEGPAYRHVQLREGTVSRSHARMALREGDWHLTNLSSTNPVVLNEHILSPGEERLLADGDRIEMGEVVFGFRSR